MGQADRGGARRVVRLVVGQPAQLGHRERRDRHRTDRVGPRGSAVTVAAQLGDQVVRRTAGPGVVPQQRGAYDVPLIVQADHAVLLSADGDRGDVVQPTRRGARLLQRIPPGPRIDLGAVGMRGTPRADDLSRCGIADQDLAGLGRGVDSGNQRHVAQPSELHHGRPAPCVIRPHHVSGLPRLGPDALAEPDRRRPLRVRRHRPPETHLATYTIAGSLTPVPGCRRPPLRTTVPR